MKGTMLRPIDADLIRCNTLIANSKYEIIKSATYNQFIDKILQQEIFTHMALLFSNMNMGKHAAVTTLAKAKMK